MSTLNEPPKPSNPCDERRAVDEEVVRSDADDPPPGRLESLAANDVVPESSLVGAVKIAFVFVRDAEANFGEVRMENRGAAVDGHGRIDARLREARIDEREPQVCLRSGVDADADQRKGVAENPSRASRAVSGHGGREFVDRCAHVDTRATS
ncbi:hypothetical protein [Plantibacter sp. lyk4-40-MEA-4]|uniref:hypothetical protein n=1 Tax=Plantibacter sp. lyk4-40-MEA-4 TaxID=3040298 RepID=UPI00254C7AE2|nr:hypothetical protein [Plantibacter sp. lyk4-40-MEA-4]